MTKEHVWLTICSGCGGVVEERDEAHRDCYGKPLPSQRLYYPDTEDILEGCDCNVETLRSLGWTNREIGYIRRG